MLQWALQQHNYGHCSEPGNLQQVSWLCQVYIEKQAHDYDSMQTTHVYTMAGQLFMLCQACHWHVLSSSHCTCFNTSDKITNVACRA